MSVTKIKEAFNELKNHEAPDEGNVTAGNFSSSKYWKIPNFYYSILGFQKLAHNKKITLYINVFARQLKRIVE